MSTEAKNRYFRELTLNLRHEGFIVGQPEDGLLPVESEDKRLCLATDSGGVRYWREDIDSDARGAALDQVTAIVKTTAEYMSQLETAPLLGVGPKGDYRLLADFNNTVLAGHPTQYGAEFITWERTNKRSALDHGHYYGPSIGADSYTAAKQDFATRSGLIPRSALRLSAHVLPAPRGSSPKARFGLRHNRNWPLLCMEENREADFAICTRYPQNIVLHPPVPAFPICSGFRLGETAAR